MPLLMANSDWPSVEIQQLRNRIAQLEAKLTQIQDLLEYHAHEMHQHKAVRRVARDLLNLLRDGTNPDAQPTGTERNAPECGQ